VVDFVRAYRANTLQVRYMHNITFYCEACARPRNSFFIALKRRDKSGPPLHAAQALQFCVFPKKRGVTP